MKKQFFMMLLVVAMAAACTTETKDHKAIPAYRVVNHSKIVEDTSYYKIDIQYPYFVSQDTDILKKLEVLNQNITSFLDTAQQWYWGSTIDEVIQIKQETNAAGIYELMNRYDILDTTSSLISLKFETYSFALGAHGFTGINTFNFDLKRGKMLQLTDVLDLQPDENLKALNNLLSRYFINPGNCFDEKPSVKRTHKKFAVSPDDLIIYFEAYELGPYACGSAEISIPVKALKKAGLWQL